LRGYRPKQAQRLAEGRRQSKVKPRISSQTWDKVRGFLKQKMSLEQIEYFIERVYQQKRIHSSLGYVTPEEFELQWKSVHSHVEIPLSK
ncbi:MAG: hypothetical protein K8R40_13545, partial [Anaerolineaceae bacterium]|nr:hypothetical protein [Anaerolineaceae bacterium]